MQDKVEVTLYRTLLQLAFQAPIFLQLTNQKIKEIDFGLDDLIEINQRVSGSLARDCLAFLFLRKLDSLLSAQAAYLVLFAKKIWPNFKAAQKKLGRPIHMRIWIK